MGKKIGISDTEGHRLFKRLVSFLGEEEILRRLAAIDRQKKLEKGIYLDYWVKPTTIWWEGLRDALNELATSGSLKRKLTDIMLNPFLTAAYINSLFSSMSPEVRKEFASRILNSEQLTLVLSS